MLFYSELNCSYRTFENLLKHRMSSHRAQTLFVRTSKQRTKSTVSILTSITWLLALSRSRLISASILCRMANLQALWQISVISAPENPWVAFAMYIKSTSYNQTSRHGNNTENISVLYTTIKKSMSESTWCNKPTTFRSTPNYPGCSLDGQSRYIKLPV